MNANYIAAIDAARSAEVTVTDAVTIEMITRSVFEWPISGDHLARARINRLARNSKDGS